MFLLQLLAFITISSTTLLHAEETSPSKIVSYDKANDQLNVSAETVSLKRVLGKIAMKSGIEVLFDDKADEPLSINMQSVPLEHGIKQILKGERCGIAVVCVENNCLSSGVHSSLFQEAGGVVCGW